MPKKCQVLISGMGPGGLASAWEAATQGKKVLILSNREDDFIRVQRVFLSIENREYLLRMLFKEGSPELSSLNILDKQFFDELVTSTTLSLKNIERYLKRRLDELPKDQVSYQYQVQLSKVNLEKGSCSIESLKPEAEPKNEIESVDFDFLIGADGVNHHAAELLNQGQQTPLLAYRTIESPKRTQHGSFYLTLEREDGEKLILPKKQLIGMLLEAEEETEMVSTFAFDHFSYCKNQGKKVKCSFTGELPNEIIELLENSEDKQEKAEAVRAYLDFMLNRSFAEQKIYNGKLKVVLVAASKKHGLQKDKLKFHFFQSQLMEANTAAVKMQDKYFILVGDAYRRPNYQFGHGINDALLHAQLAGLLISGGLSLDDYNKACKLNSEETTNKTGFFNALPAEKRCQVIRELEEEAEKSRKETWDKYKLKI